MDLTLQLQPWPARGFAGVLSDCTGLTSLHLKNCNVNTTPEASAAITALPELQHLHLECVYNELLQYSYGYDEGLIPDLQRTSKLTYLFIEPVHEPAILKQLGHLSALRHLEHLSLSCLGDGGVPGGLPSQLDKLTALHIMTQDGMDATTHFQHFSSFTARQELDITCNTVLTGDLRGIGQLGQLRSLELICQESNTTQFNTDNTRSWSQLTALESLCMSGCAVHPDGLMGCTQLQELAMEFNATLDTPVETVLAAVSKLTLLTELDISINDRLSPVIPVASSAALTASTNLCVLRLSWTGGLYTSDSELFRPGTVHPQLHTTSLLQDDLGLVAGTMPLCHQQLQLLCTACPAVSSLHIALLQDPSPTACQPLLQLSALTQLTLQAMCVDAAAGLQYVGQLTKLKQLRVLVVAAPRAPALLPLTSLPSLESLDLLTTERIELLNLLHLQVKARVSPPSACCDSVEVPLRPHSVDSSMAPHIVGPIMGHNLLQDGSRDACPTHSVHRHALYCCQRCHRV